MRSAPEPKSSEGLVGVQRSFTGRCEVVVHCEEIMFDGARKYRVLAVVPFDEEDESPFVGLLQVEPR